MGSRQMHIARIRDDGQTTLMVEKSDSGRTIICTASIENGILDVLRVALSWKSLRRLQKSASRPVFEWEIKDGSLMVRGSGDLWTCEFRGTVPNFGAEVQLTETETALLREALFA